MEQRQQRTESLKQDSRMRVLFGDISLSEFITKLPSVELRTEVSNDVVQAFQIVHKLLIHAYFEYLFIDVAVTKALHTLEMALKIRYNEITSLSWKKSAPLQQLLEWFRSRSYFERDDPSFFERVRNSRNYLSHPTGFNFAGTASLHWIETTIGLVNDIYDDINLRKERKMLEKQFDALLNVFIKNGVKFKQDGVETLIYGSAGIVVNNKLKPFQYSFALLPMFDPATTELKPPILFQTDDLSIFSSCEIIIGSGSSDKPILLSQKVNSEQKASIAKFSERCKTEDHFSMIQTMMLHDADTFLRKELRKIRSM